MEIIVVCGTIIRMAKQRKILEIYPIKGHKNGIRSVMETAQRYIRPVKPQV